MQLLRKIESALTDAVNEAAELMDCTESTRKAREVELLVTDIEKALRTVQGWIEDAKRDFEER